MHGLPSLYLGHLAQDWEAALATHGSPPRLAELLAKLVRSGFVAPSPHGSFWASIGPALVARWQGGAPARTAFTGEYTHAWHDVCAELGTALDAVLYALAAYLDQLLTRTHCAWPLDVSELGAGSEGKHFLSTEAAYARSAAYSLLELVGGGDEDVARMDAVHIGSAYPGTLWCPLLSLALAAWTPHDALPDLVTYWASAERCVRTSVKQEQSLTAMLLAYTTDASAKGAWEAQAHSPLFLEGVSRHLDHTDATIRRLGMLVAERVSRITIAPPTKPLSFPSSVWDGRGDGREVCRVLRALADSFQLAEIADATVDAAAWAGALHLHEEPKSLALPEPAPARPAPKTRRLPERVPAKLPPRAPARPKIEVLDEATDEFHTYAPPPQHDMSSDEGADSESDEGEDDKTTLDSAFAKPRPVPVYVYELAPLARERDVYAQKTLLKHAEPLLRRKTGWGAEIAEHAVDLCVALCSMQDTYSLRAFEERRTAALAALCIACPDPVADCLYEQLFLPHYAVAQRIAMLHAVAYAAQELAGQRTPEHIDAATTRLADDAATHAREAGERQTAAADPERHAARVRRHALRSALVPETPLPFAPEGSVRPTVAYTTAALPAFLFPLLNRYWTYCQAHRGQRVLRAGGDVALSVPVLGAILQTLAVLCYYAQNAPHFYQRLVPDVLEMVDAVLATPDADALVTGAALSLALIVLQATLQASQGLDLVRAHAPLLARLQQAAQGCFAAEETRAGLGAPTPEVLAAPSARARRCAAAVVVQLAELQDEAQRAFFHPGRVW